MNKPYYKVELKRFNSLSFISASISSNKRLDRYLSAVSASMQSIFEPFGTLFATSMATAKVDPPDMPVRIPS